MEWDVELYSDYVAEFEAEPEAVQNEIFALIKLLKLRGPQLARPHCDTLNGSTFPNMKELRFSLPGGEWRVAFAFDPGGRAILLVGASKSGISQRRFYRELVRVADMRFAYHLASVHKDVNE